MRHEPDVRKLFVLISDNKNEQNSDISGYLSTKYLFKQRCEITAFVYKKLN